MQERSSWKQQIGSKLLTSFAEVEDRAPSGGRFLEVWASTFSIIPTFQFWYASMQTRNTNTTTTVRKNININFLEKKHNSTAPYKVIAPNKSFYWMDFFLSSSPQKHILWVYSLERTTRGRAGEGGVARGKRYIFPCSHEIFQHFPLFPKINITSNFLCSLLPKITVPLK